jgi:hypothetical protein
MNAPLPLRKIIEGATRYVPREDEPPTSRGHAAPLILATAFEPFDPRRLPPRQLIMGNHYHRRNTCVTAGTGGVSKSLRVKVDAISMVLGRDLMGLDKVYGGRKRVWVMNLEDDRIEIQRRIAAICLRYDVDQADLEGLFIDSGRERELLIAREDREGVLINQPVVDALKHELLANEIDVLIVDPFVESHTVSESLNDSLKIVMAQWRQIAHDCNIAVELVHHIRKNGGIEASVDDVRGASAMIGSARSVRLISAMSEKEAQAFGIEPKERRRYVSVNPHGKANFAPPSDVRDWYHLESIALNNGAEPYWDGDVIGVPVVWALPGPLSGMTIGDCAEIQALCAAQSDPGATARANKTAGGWFGKLVAQRLDIDILEPEGVKSVERILAALVKEKWLVEGFAKDSKREQKPVFLAVPQKGSE